MDVIEKYSQVYWSPFLVWVFLWVNAIKDVALYVDWPDCIFYKADFIYKTHDLNSKLKAPSIDSKLYFSWVMPNKMVREYDNKIKRKLTFIEKNSKFKLWVITCMPVTWLLATQYSNIYSDLEKDFIFVPSYTDKYRLDWYSIFLRELAKYIKIDKNKEKLKLNISIVWFMYDRDEWDCNGNIEEIKRILGLLWVTINSIWLSWWDIDDLKEIEKSELIVSLPYWKNAAEILSKKTWVDLIETEIPFWFKNVVSFIKKIWNKLGIDKKLIESVIKKELSIVVDKVNLLDNNIFADKNYIYAGDPFLEDSIKDIWNYLWMNHINSHFYTWTKQAKADDYANQKLDLIIWTSDHNINIREWTVIEFWFPSYNIHYLMNTPFMWFRGLIYFIERMYKEILKDSR